MVWSIPRGLIVLLAGAGGVVVVVGMRAFAGVLAPVFLALMLTVAVQPVQGWVRGRGGPAWLGLLAALATVVGVLVALVAALLFSVAQLGSVLPGYADELGALLDDVRELLANAGISQDRIHSALSQIDVGKVVAAVDGVLGGLLGLVSNLVFVLALLMFMAFDGMTIGPRMAVVTRLRPDIAGAFATFVDGTRSYLVVSTVFGFVVAVLDGAALWLLGVPLPLLWALVSFLTNYIPNIGFVIGVIPPAALALLEGGPGLMLWVIAIYCVINVVIQSIIQPKFVGDAVGLSVTVTFLSLVFWGWVLGALGALLAVPLTLLAKALLLDIDPTTRWVDALISHSGAEPESPETDEAPAPPRAEG
ncbi:AI-2E family transporter [Nocardia sp. NPDC057353]|uniref:AI-2E family transporter n=1 Tax=Nocardia sp. NPDC057353 TaxID=3346104 RepID=UPI003633E218